MMTWSLLYSRNKIATLSTAKSVARANVIHVYIHLSRFHFYSALLLKMPSSYCLLYYLFFCVHSYTERVTCNIRDNFVFFFIFLFILMTIREIEQAMVLRIVENVFVGCVENENFQFFLTNITYTICVERNSMKNNNNDDDHHHAIDNIVMIMVMPKVDIVVLKVENLYVMCLYYTYCTF